MHVTQARGVAWHNKFGQGQPIYIVGGLLSEPDKAAVHVFMFWL